MFDVRWKLGLVGLQAGCLAACAPLSPPTPLVVAADKQVSALKFEAEAADALAKLSALPEEQREFAVTREFHRGVALHPLPGTAMSYEMARIYFNDDVRRQLERELDVTSPERRVLCRCFGVMWKRRGEVIFLVRRAELISS